MDWRLLADRALSWTSGWPVWLRYVATILTVCVVGSAWERLNSDRPYLMFFPTIILCAIIFNRGSGYIATIMAAIFSAAFLLPSDASGHFKASDRVTLPLFILVGLAIATIVEILRTRVSELRISEQKALILASEKQLLIDELAHRTRNDLANVVTLINLQASKSSEAVRDALHLTADRVRTLARVHHRLEITNKRVVVNSKEFLEDLCTDLQLATLAERPVAIATEIDSHSIGIEKAVPLGLIVNELVTNAAKHAFPDGRSGTIKVTFSREDQFYILSVQDDGVGLPEAVRQGTGSHLLRLLAGQLGSGYEAGPASQGSGTRALVRIRVKTETTE